MARKLAIALVGASTVALGGCAAAIAANAVGLAAQSARGQPQSNQHLQPAARTACSAHAGQYGAVHVIDVQQRTVSKITVWGTVQQGNDRRSFECNFTDKITSFKLRPIVRSF
jgi:hypothetical protein